MYNGVINVYKEKGYTSFDVVARLRKLLKQKKIGHTGTLDPDAEGVLVICLGRATKLCGILTDKDKTYETTLLLGKTSDTEDRSGTILSESEVTATPEEVRKVIMSFVGEYEQVPPMYSAIKINGKRLYALARKGEVVERKPRPVMIHNIEIQNIELPYVTFTVSCGKGTYIRSLCRDIGERLGCGGLMDRLVRNSVYAAETGIVFDKEGAHTLGEIEQIALQEKLEELILPMDAMFPNLTKCYVKEGRSGKLYNGNLLRLDDFQEAVTVPVDGGKYLIYDENRVFCAVYQYDKRMQEMKVDSMFYVYAPPDSSY